MQFYERPQQGYPGYNQYGQPQQFEELYDRKTFDPYNNAQNWNTGKLEAHPQIQQYTPYATTTFDDNEEEPLMTELGINFYSIGKRTLSVVNPFIKIDKNVVLESDLAGPLVYFIAFGLLLLMSGKLNGFGAIYGVTASSSFFMWCILNLMNISLSFVCIISIVGYGLLPMVIAAMFTFVFHLTAWSSCAATNMVSTLNNNVGQYFLILYPFILIYGFYAAMIIFPY